MKPSTSSLSVLPHSDRARRSSRQSCLFRAFRDADRHHHAGKILFRRSALRAGGPADARARDATADAQPDASAARQAVHRAVDPCVRRRSARLALSRRAVRRARHRGGVSLRACAVREQGPRSRRACSPFSTRCCSCNRGSRCWIFSRSPSACSRSRLHAWLSSERPHRWFALAGFVFGLSIGCKWSGLFVLAVCIVIVAVIRLMQGWRTQFADARR